MTKSEESHRVIVQSEYYNALYVDGEREHQGKPEYINAETLARLYPDAEIYWVDDDLYEVLLDGDGYPDLLSALPLTEFKQIR